MSRTQDEPVLSTIGVIPSINKLSGGYGTANRFLVPLHLLTAKIDLYTTRFSNGAEDVLVKKVHEVVKKVRP